MEDSCRPVFAHAIAPSSHVAGRRSLPAERHAMHALGCLAMLVGASGAAVAQDFPTSPFDAAAGKQLWINMGGTSQHFRNADRFNQQNSGFGVEYDFGNERSFIIGEYKNSVRSNSRYIGAAWTPLTFGPVKVGALVGVVDGYRKMRGGDFFPVALPVVAIETRYVGVNFTVMPSIAGNVSGCVAMQWKVRFR